MRPQATHVFPSSAVTALLCLVATSALGQTGTAIGPARYYSASPAGTGSVPPVTQDSVKATQAAAWGAFYAGKYPEAAKLCEGLFNTKDERPRLEAIHCWARCQWALGSKPSRAVAEKAWGQAAKNATVSASTARRDLAKIIAQGSDVLPDRLPQVIGELEAICKAKPVGTATAEAAIELGRLYVLAGRYDDAKSVLEFVGAYMKDLTRLEIMAAEAAPFLSAAQAALDHLKYDRDKGREPFEKARALQEARKFKEAVTAYQGVAKAFPQTDYAPRSMFHTGECLRDMGKSAEALAYWNQFFKAEPAGAWRGQALTGLVDLYLEDSLDVESARVQVVVALDNLNKGLESLAPAAKSSWQEAASDVYLRIGIVAYLRGQYPGAANALRASCDAAGQSAAQMREWLAPVIAAADAGQPLTPADVAATGDGEKEVLALALGRIHLAAHRYDRAETAFLRTQRPSNIGRPTAAQAAYGEFGMALVQMGRGKPDDAKKAFLESLKLCPSGSWHDSSLYGIASIIQQEADRRHPKADPAAKKSDISKQPHHQMTSAEREAAATEEAQRLSALRKERAQSLPYWRDLANRFSQSPYDEVAAYYAGLLSCEASNWTTATELMKQFLEGHPQSPWSGQAYLLLIDTALERTYDLAAAEGWAAKAAVWAASHKDHASAKEPAAQVPLLVNGVPLAPTERELRESLYETYVRVGLVAYLDQQYDRAVEMFTAADAFAPTRGFVVVSGHVPTAMERMVGAAKDQRKLTPDEVLSGDPRGKLILQLAALFKEAGENDRAIALCDMVIGDPKSGAPQQSWAHFTRGESIYNSDLCKAAKADFFAAQQRSPSSAWAATALFYAGTVTNNFEQDKPAANEIFTTVVKLYPKTEVAERSAYFLGINLQYLKNWAKAKEAYEALLKRYPDSRWAKSVAENRLPQVERELQATKNVKQ